MRRLAHLAVFTFLIATAASPSVQGEERFLTFVFGPGSAQAAREAARASADAARYWLRAPGAHVRVRRTGSPDVLTIDARMGSKQLTQVLAETAMAARDADAASFLTALDAAAQATALDAGKRIVVAVLNGPPLSSEAERTIADLVEFCRSKAVRVIVLDIDEGGRAGANSALEILATKTGGMWLRRAKLLELNVAVVARAAADEHAEIVSAAPTPPAAATQASARAGTGHASGIPVQIRFIRTSMTGTVSSGVVAQMGEAGNTSVSTIERPYEANEYIGPMRGMVIVESPLSALKFAIDDSAKTYTARARVVAIVRNSKGAAVWTGRKEVNIRGPLGKLETRRRGSLFFLRGVTLPGGERYKLEANVEDMPAGGAGAITLALRTGKGAPGIMASDALFVRPFSRSADKFEADQVFSYDGEALSPVLDPVFRAEGKIDLQLYFVIYPDIQGVPLDLSLELSREGRVVARMPLPFKDQVGNRALEGKFGTLPGKGSAILGGRVREFPYLANLKGARLSGGEYQAVVSIRQGRNVITRAAAFRVIGDAPVVAGTQAAGDEAEDLNVVLPEIEPATVDSSGLGMSREEQVQLWEEAAKNALGYSRRLPNFRCTQETHRLTAPVKSPDQLKEADSFKEELMYEDGKERYRTVEINGTKADIARSELKGVQSRGEFGSMLKGLFDPAVAASYRWSGRAIAMGVLCEVFDIEVTNAKSELFLVHNKLRETVGYTGRVFIDADAGLVRRVVIQGAGLPKEFALQSPAFSLEYGMVRIGSDDYLLPLRSVLQVRHLKKFVRNETMFRDYRKFDASSEIKFERK